MTSRAYDVKSKTPDPFELTDYSLSATATGLTGSAFGGYFRDITLSFPTNGGHSGGTN